MTPLPRGTCPICDRNVPLRNNGRMREHRSQGSLRSSLCSGSGYSVEFAKDLLARERQEQQRSEERARSPRCRF